MYYGKLFPGQVVTKYLILKLFRKNDCLFTDPVRIRLIYTIWQIGSAGDGDMGVYNEANWQCSLYYWDMKQ